ncbi:30S ribosomal protein S8 [Candidatus Daviesbacteria bacterium]|nr:30S ribosomal protein S8 [Candidatus Daviesbacteria bacterium]
MNDPVADALIRIKNGYQVGKEQVLLRYSKLILKLIQLLKKEGYIESVSHKDREIKVILKYHLRKPAITEIERVSKPSLRIYKGVKDLPRVLNGLGIAVISTPKGLMTDNQARAAKVGGEVLALIW